MDDHQQLLQRLAEPGSSRIVLLVLDGVGDLRTLDQPRTALDRARTPRLDALARRSSLGRLVPVASGITPGSGPGHLGLFGYDPRRPEVDIGRGVLEALGLELEIGPETLAARGNFATADKNGDLTDRRAGRIPTEECRRLCKKLQAALDDASLGDLETPIQATVHAGEAHRFVLLLDGPDLDPNVADTDPQHLGVPPLDAEATEPSATMTAGQIRRVIEVLEAAIADEPQANRALLRGFSKLPNLPSFAELYQLRAGAFAGYPLYRGVAGACGMEVVPCGRRIGEIVTTVGEHWDDFDFFFLHVKQTDQKGEDGDLDGKVRVLEEVDEALEGLLALEPDVLAITADHSTPAPMAGHSWHPVPLLIHAKTCFVDETERFTETEAARGVLGTVPSRELLGLALAHAGRLAKFGA